MAITIINTLINMVVVSMIASILNVLKVGVSDFWKPMLIFEITKTNTPLPQKGLVPILIAPPHTYVAYATQA